MKSYWISLCDDNRDEVEMVPMLLKSTITSSDAKSRPHLSHLRTLCHCTKKWAAAAKTSPGCWLKLGPSLQPKLRCGEMCLLYRIIEGNKCMYPATEEEDMGVPNNCGAHSVYEEFCRRRMSDSQIWSPVALCNRPVSRWCHLCASFLLNFPSQFSSRLCKVSPKSLHTIGLPHTLNW